MKRGSPMQALASSPTMVGAITTLIVIVAVFLAYNANNGLPFVPVYRVSVVVPNASRLVQNNEVRIGGNRVGVVESIDPVRLPLDDPTSDSKTGGDTGGVVARLNLKLDKSASPIPENSIFRIRYKSSFGLKFLEITRGDGQMAPEGYTFNGTNDNDDPADDDDQILSIDEVGKNKGADDGTFIAQTEFDEIGNTFDQATRNAIRQNLAGYGDGFAARGSSLNQAIEALNPLLTNLLPVAKTLNAKETNLQNFFPALARTAAIVAPVADQNAELFKNMAVTFAAIGADPDALRATISGGPPALQTGIDVLPGQRPFLRDSTELFRRLNPGIKQLRIALPSLNGAIEVGTPVLARSVAANQRLRGVFRQTENLVDQPTTKSSLVRLKDLFGDARPLAEYVTPAQTVCNYWNYMWTLLPEHLSESDSVGYTQRVSLINSPTGPITLNLDLDGNGFDPDGPGPIPPGPDLLPPVKTTIPGQVETGIAGGGYSGAQANGRSYSPGGPGEFQPHTNPILHANPTGPTGQNGSDCQPGQTGYLLGRLPVKGQGAANPAVIKPDIPGDQGVTDVYWKRNGTRIQKDTRVAARQP
jgi:ABC-type transporter Mla subunit MlaD